MVRIVDLEELDLRAELGDDGRISRVLDQRGNEMGLVAAKTDPLTGGIKCQAGSNAFYAEGTNPPSGTGIEIMPVSDLTKWNTDKTAAVTVSIDTTVLYNGQPTIRIDVPAGTSGTVKVGTASTDCRIPYNWDRKGSAVAVKYSNVALSPAGFNFYVGDSTYANFWNGGINTTHYTPSQVLNNEWWIAKLDTLSVGGGSPVLASTMRCKLQFTAVSQATNESIWIGFCGAYPPKKKPEIILTLDDGFASWYSFIRPLAKHYDIPVSMGIISGSVGNANYLTRDQILEMYNDGSRLFDFVNHSTNNNAYGTIGAAAYYANLVTCRNYLQGIGIYGDGPSHVPYTQTQSGDDLYALMAAGGFLSGRMGGYSYEYARDGMYATGLDKHRWMLNIISGLQTGVTLANAQTAVNTVVTDNGFGMINAHDFATADAAYVWSYDKMEQLFGWLAAQRDAGTINIKSWSRWYADLTGRHSDRR